MSQERTNTGPSTWGILKIAISLIVVSAILMLAIIQPRLKKLNNKEPVSLCRNLGGAKAMGTNQQITTEQQIEIKLVKEKEYGNH